MQKKLLQEAFALHQMGRIQDARVVYEKILELHPFDLDTLHLMALLAQQDGRLEQALRYFQTAVTVKPDFAQLYAHYGRALFDSNLLEQALANFQISISIDPTDVEPYLDLGMIMHKLGRLNQAIHTCDRGIVMHPENAIAHFNRAAVLNDLDCIEQALTSYQRSMFVEPENIQTHSAQGMLFRKIGKIHEAAVCYNHAIILEPENPEIYFHQGVILGQMNNKEQASTCFDRSITICPTHAEALLSQGNMFILDNDFISALKSYDRALTLQENHSLGHFNRGLILRNMGRLGEAIDDFMKAIISDCAFAEPYFALAVTLLQFDAQAGSPSFFETTNRLSQKFSAFYTHLEHKSANFSISQLALDLASNAIKIKPNYAEAYNWRGSVLAELDRIDDAILNFSEAIEHGSIEPEIHLNYGIMLLKAHKYKQAVMSFDVALQIRPDYADVLFHRGNAFQALSCHQEALWDFEKAFLVHPQFADAYMNCGTALVCLNRLKEAITCQDTAISLKCDSHAYYNNRALTLHASKQFDEALLSFDEAISLKPDYSEAIYNKGMSLLLCSQFQEGWEAYEHRLLADSFVRTSLGAYSHFLTRVDKISDHRELMNKHVFLIGEQGVGDVLMFSSIIPDLLSVASRIEFIVDRRLKGILQSSFPSIRVMDHYIEGSIPNDAVVLYIGSLGNIFRKNPNHFSGNRFLYPDQSKIAIWKNRLGETDRKLIGISWRGGTVATRSDARSASVSNFLSLFANTDYTLVSLQYGGNHEELHEVANAIGVKVLSFAPMETNDLGDLSALVGALDAVVTVQNSNVHLCGALGVPCIGILPALPEWRYGLNGEDMLWYNSVRLLRRGEDQHFLDLEDSVVAHLSQIVDPR